MLPNQEKVIANSGAFISTVLTSGVGGGLAFLAGGMMASSEDSTIVSTVYIKPTTGKNMFGGDIIRSSLPSNGDYSSGVVVEYKREKDRNVSDDLVLKMLAEQWIKWYVADAKPVQITTPNPAPQPDQAVAPAAASSVAATSTGQDDTLRQ